MNFFVAAALASVPGSWSWFLDLAAPVLVVQAVGGLIGLGTLVLVTKRFLSTDFPAAMSSVNGRLDTLHRDLEALERRFQEAFVDLQLVKERQATTVSRVDKIEARNSNLDDTGGGMRRPPRRSS